jgi:hypothetical protein
MSYCSHNGTCHGELVLRPFHARIVCDRCGTVVTILEANPITRIAITAEMKAIRALDPEESATPADYPPHEAWTTEAP